ncbi:hypothetical protein B0H16DRAFT_1591126 [Mycena metata]|uniref:F-box domain-containing protein n=1 Tax=Mycena metata TaxID=1033252 RepID=A0AAD7HSF5_9AGAR|nr:hypothetical protein B0H16DRAFT_1591126 [Mycena metata]
MPRKILSLCPNTTDSSTSYRPVLTLPTEIVVEIFIHFLPVYPRCPPLGGLGSPILLTQICRDWREIALATRRLWRAISVDTHWIVFPREVARTRIWLQRSHPLPVSLRCGPPIAFPAAFFRAITPYRQRWAYLDLRLQDDTQLAALCDGPTPLLKCLDLSLNSKMTHVDPVVAFSDAPLLHTVLLDFPAAMLTLPWAQLTSLTLKLVDAPKHLSILKLASNLRDLHLVLEQKTFGSLQGADILIPRLESLKLCAKLDRPLGATFILPALRHFAIVEYLNPEPIAALADFIASAGCTQLDELSITVPDSASISKDAYPAYRKAFPGVLVSIAKRKVPK